METKRTILVPLEQYYRPIEFSNIDTTHHFKNDRKWRHDNIMSHIGNGNYLTSFECYTAHKNGDEIHSLFDNGIIVIQNVKTKKVITELVARRGQFKRYWLKMGLDFPTQYNHILAKCDNHVSKGYNQDKWD